MKLDGIVREMIDSYETGNSKQMNHKQWYLYACVLASRRMSVLALCFVMKLVWGVMDGDYIVSMHSAYTRQFNEPYETGVTTL